MTKYLLSTDDVAELSGITTMTVGNYVKNGLVEPARDITTNGPGGGRMFSPSAAIGMLYVQQYRSMGIDGEAILNMMTAISALTLNEIEDLIEEGRTVCFPLTQNHASAKKEYMVEPQWISPAWGEGSPTFTKSDRMLWETLNIAHAHAKVMVRLGQRYPELTKDPEAPPQTEEDKTVEFLKNARRVSANLVNNKRAARKGPARGKKHPRRRPR